MDSYSSLQLKIDPFEHAKTVRIVQLLTNIAMSMAFQNNRLRNASERLSYLPRMPFPHAQNEARYH